MKVRSFCFSALLSALVLFADLCIGSAYGTATTVIGPGPHQLLYVTSPEDYHVLDGTQIISPSETGPPSTFVVVTDAIEFRGGGHIQIDGGYFRGGNATYTGPNGTTASTVAGNALHLRQSTGTVFGGTFVGGDATSTTWSGPTQGAEAVLLVESQLTIYGGSFSGGVGTSPDFFGETRVRASLVTALADSSLFVHGGHFHGLIGVGAGSTLTIFARDFQVDGLKISGEYADGTLFTHEIAPYGGTIILKALPEPTSACLAATASCVALGCRRRRPSA